MEVRIHYRREGFTIMARRSVKYKKPSYDSNNRLISTKIVEVPLDREQTHHKEYADDRSNKIFSERVFFHPGNPGIQKDWTVVDDSGNDRAILSIYHARNSAGTRVIYEKVVV